MPTELIGENKSVSLRDLHAIKIPSKKEIEFDNAWYKRITAKLQEYFAEQLQDGGHVSSWALNRTEGTLSVILARPKSRK
ncbi:MAG TPA: hypothetical protein VLH19_02315 [Patescibacteria group bacterium]|nr:hypothetical protein [Patescibacteria group bacterium]